MNFEIIALEIVFSAQRSRGPGGQHVNKTNSAAQLSWNYLESHGVLKYEKDLIQHKLESLINKENVLVLRSDSFRDLESNKKECLKKLRQNLAKALKRDKPRIATKPTYSSKQRRHSEKKHRGEIKKGRGSNWSE